MDPGTREWELLHHEAALISNLTSPGARSTAGISSSVTAGASILLLSLAKTASDPPSWGARLCKDHSPRRTEVIGSITSRRIYGRSTVDCGGNRERFASWRADQWFGWALTLLDGRIDGGGHRLREAARPGRQLALR